MAFAAEFTGTVVNDDESMAGEVARALRLLIRSVATDTSMTRRSEITASEVSAPTEVSWHPSAGLPRAEDVADLMQPGDRLRIAEPRFRLPGTRR